MEQIENNHRIIEILDSTYKEYLKDDGKWLHEGFRAIFIDGEASATSLKTSVYLMLPYEIRKHVDQLLSDHIQ